MAKVVVYGTDYCPFCHRARALLDNKGIEYEYVECDNKPDVRAKIEKLSGMTTVPQIFINEQSIGGCDDLYALDANGNLDAILSK